MRLQPFQFVVLPGSVGVTTGGSLAAPTAIDRVRDRGWTNIRLLDVCCGVGTLGLTMLWDLGPGIIESLVIADISPPNVQSARETVANLQLPCVEVVESDGLASIPEYPKFDLIVSNPPHFDSPDPTRHSGDPDWHFHRQFFADVPRYLRPGGEVWLLEVFSGDVPALAREILDPSLMEIVAFEQEQNDPPYGWLLLRSLQ